MKAHSALRAVCFLISSACLVLAYVQIGAWLVLLAMAAMALLWLATSRRSEFWAASGVLALYSALAVIGIVSGASALLLAIGSIFALAAWDLSDPRGSASVPAAHPGGSVLERQRLRSLAVVTGASVLLVVAGSLLRLQLPFGVVAFLALITMGCIIYSLHRLLNAAAQHGRR